MHTSAKTTPRTAKAKINPKASQGTTKMTVMGGSGTPSAEGANYVHVKWACRTNHLSASQRHNVHCSGQLDATINVQLDTPPRYSANLETQTPMYDLPGTQYLPYSCPVS